MLLYYIVNLQQYHTLNSFSVWSSNILSPWDLNFIVTTIRHFQVVIPDSNTGEEVVVASLSEGNYFGEISLLRLDEGKNRSEYTDFK